MTLNIIFLDFYIENWNRIKKNQFGTECYTRVEILKLEPKVLINVLTSEESKTLVDF